MKDWVELGKLPKGDPRRSQSLWKLKAQCLPPGATEWRLIEKHWLIAGCSYNDLGKGWKTTAVRIKASR